MIRRGGVLEKWGRLRLLSERVLIEDALKYLHVCEYERRPAHREGLIQALEVSARKADGVIRELESREFLRRSGSEDAPGPVTETEVLHLTEEGRDHAIRVVRAHRVWERYLADETGMVEAAWHREANRREHSLTKEEVDALAAGLGNPAYDPHGDPIPTAAGELPPHNGRSLTTLTPGEWAVIAHIEDEPEPLYEQLVAAGIYPGMQIQLLAGSEKRVRIWARDGEQVLSPALAALVSVVPLAEEAGEQDKGDPLTTLQPGQKAVVTSISQTCRKHERRRLMDLGILPGTVIEAVMRSPGGDPIAYRIRGALIALREEQSRSIYISREAVEAA
ncbi:MAG: hypothetical protein EHM61_08735 [Acidobacteria bacterium]|nr:MAG: hypothetical protein EHM61_08735 [Acidobacteriota bacterium]